MSRVHLSERSFVPNNFLPPPCCEQLDHTHFLSSIINSKESYTFEYFNFIVKLSFRNILLNKVFFTQFPFSAEYRISTRLVKNHSNSRRSINDHQLLMPKVNKPGCHHFIVDNVDTNIITKFKLQEHTFCFLSAFVMFLKLNKRTLLDKTMFRKLQSSTNRKF